jgi:hypothetical protein
LRLNCFGDDVLNFGSKDFAPMWDAIALFFKGYGQVLKEEHLCLEATEKNLEKMSFLGAHPRLIKWGKHAQAWAACSSKPERMVVSYVHNFPHKDANTVANLATAGMVYTKYCTDSKYFKFWSELFDTIANKPDLSPSIHKWTDLQIRDYWTGLESGVPKPQREEMEAQMGVIGDHIDTWNNGKDRLLLCGGNPWNPGPEVELDAESIETRANCFVLFVFLVVVACFAWLMCSISIKGCSAATTAEKEVGNPFFGMNNSSSKVKSKTSKKQTMVVKATKKPVGVLQHPEVVTAIQKAKALGKSETMASRVRALISEHGPKLAKTAGKHLKKWAQGRARAEHKTVDVKSAEVQGDLYAMSLVDAEHVKGARVPDIKRYRTAVAGQVNHLVLPSIQSTGTDVNYCSWFRVSPTVQYLAAYGTTFVNGTQTTSAAQNDILYSFAVSNWISQRLVSLKIRVRNQTAALSMQGRWAFVLAPVSSAFLSLDSIETLANAMFGNFEPTGNQDYCEFSWSPAGEPDTLFVSPTTYPVSTNTAIYFSCEAASGQLLELDIFPNWEYVCALTAEGVLNPIPLVGSESAAADALTKAEEVVSGETVQNNYGDTTSGGSPSKNIWEIIMDVAPDVMKILPFGEAVSWIGSTIAGWFLSADYQDVCFFLRASKLRVEAVQSMVDEGYLPTRVAEAVRVLADLDLDFDHDSVSYRQCDGVVARVTMPVQTTSPLKRFSEEKVQGIPKPVVYHYMLDSVDDVHHCPMCPLEFNCEYTENSAKTPKSFVSVSQPAFSVPSGSQTPFTGGKLPPLRR